MPYVNFNLFQGKKKKGEAKFVTRWNVKSHWGRPLARSQFRTIVVRADCSFGDSDKNYKPNNSLIVQASHERNTLRASSRFPNRANGWIIKNLSLNKQQQQHTPHSLLVFFGGEEDAMPRRKRKKKSTAGQINCDHTTRKGEGGRWKIVNQSKRNRKTIINVVMTISSIIKWRATNGTL